MKVRGHNLLWGMAQFRGACNKPAATYIKFSSRQLEEILVNHIRSVVGHYRDKYRGETIVVGRNQ
jgi:GH35 family endo-1,4-beta-xylanase